MKKPAKKKRETLADVSKVARVALREAGDARARIVAMQTFTGQPLQDRITRLEAMHAEHARFLQSLKKENEEMKSRLLALETPRPRLREFSLFEVESLLRSLSGKP